MVIEQRPVEVEADRTHWRHRASLEVDRWPIPTGHYAISAFDNAGIVTHAEGLEQFATDPFITVPLMVGVFVGSLGFPVFMVLMVHKTHLRRWNLHTKVTVTVTTGLLIVGAVMWTLLE